MTSDIAVIFLESPAEIFPCRRFFYFIKVIATGYVVTLDLVPSINGLRLNPQGIIVYFIFYTHPLLNLVLLLQDR